MIFSIAMGAAYSFYVKTIETHVRTFLPLNISAIGTVGIIKKANFVPPRKKLQNQPDTEEHVT